MNINAKTEYACSAMLELAMRFDDGEPVRVRDIAARHQTPSRFLVQILLQLKSAGLVLSTRGASGGYRLAKPPAEITLGEVMAVIDAGFGKVNCSLSNTTPTGATLNAAWEQIAAVERDLLACTFAELAQQASGQAEQMYYI